MPGERLETNEFNRHRLLFDEKIVGACRGMVEAVRLDDSNCLYLSPQELHT